MYKYAVPSSKGQCNHFLYRVWQTIGASTCVLFHYNVSMRDFHIFDEFCTQCNFKFSVLELINYSSTSGDSKQKRIPPKSGSLTTTAWMVVWGVSRLYGTHHSKLTLFLTSPWTLLIATTKNDDTALKGARLTLAAQEWWGFSKRFQSRFWVVASSPVPKYSSSSTPCIKYYGSPF